LYFRRPEVCHAPPAQVWAVPTTEMQCGWLGERVATVDVPRAIANVVHGREDAGWGPNAVFRFPKQGGTGAMWQGVAALLPAARQAYGQRVTAIDAAGKTVTLASGETVGYEKLLTTLPLDVTLRWLGKGEWAEGLTYSSTHIVGIGVRGKW
jgi:protoporphyrinogen oxidase